MAIGKTYRGLRSAPTFLVNATSMRFISRSCLWIEAYSVCDTYSKSRASRKWYSNSLAEPHAICKNRCNSALPRRPQPSAMFAGTEELQRRIWLVNPYISVLGNSFVSLYDVSTNACAFSQTFSSRKSFTFSLSCQLLTAICQLPFAELNAECQMLTASC